MTIDFERIKRAIARVEAHGDVIDKTGTAFYVGDKLVLTALHVVTGTRSGPPEFMNTISLQFSEADGSIAATVVDDLWSADGDWAVLECETRPDADPIELDPEPVSDMAWSSYGFPEISPTGMTIKGEIRDANLRPLASFAGLPRHPTLQLYCTEAAAGTGARMHGFSGAPCLVDGKAVGVLRSTLIEEMVDGQSRQLLFTQAGTMYATPVCSILELQIARREAALPGNWAPPEILLRDFIVLLSQREPNPTGAADAPRQVTLRGVATEAHRNLARRGLSKPYFLVAADAVATAERLQECVRVLCTAKVVVFDATDFEPAIMFLAGIRAVVRRGVTLLSVGGGYALGKQIKVPFNVTDANIVAHSSSEISRRSPIR